MSLPSETAAAPAFAAGEYTAEERAALLLLAHRAIEAVIEGDRPPVPPHSQHLSEVRGAFTTLHLHGTLRGCVGYIVPVYPLYQTIIETAVSAAFRDNRFPPVIAIEVPHLQIEISVLSPLRPITPEEVTVGVHGLVVTQSGRKGLLLPQVAIEWEWNRETFLSQTCRKAGLPLDAWCHGAQLEAFTAEVFGERAVRKTAGL